MKPTARRMYDVIIVGAGPAGATLGYELARQGIDVLVLEKERLPRYKTCAGGITVKAANLLGFDLSPVTQQMVDGVRVTYKGNKEFCRRYDKPLIYTVMRDEFDQLLVQRAREAGADVADNQKVCRVETTPEGVEVGTVGDTFRAEIVVGADGASGVVAGSLGLARGVQHGIAMQGEISVPGRILVKWDSLIGLVLGHIRGGYGWVFPKRDHLSVGVGGPLCQAKKLKSCYQEVLNSQGLGAYGSATPRSHLLPVLKGKATIQRGRALLLGDAAGLVDPLTGEGIYYAVRSGQIAAPVIAECLRSKVIELGGYQSAVAREIVPELRTARALTRVFTWSAGSYFDAIEGHERLWQASCRLLRGETSYVMLKRRLGKLRFVVDLLSR